MRKLALPALVFTALGTQAAIADTSSTPSPGGSTGDASPTRSGATYAIGARIGGYGFRREAAAVDRSTASPTPGAWDECRMNGLGIFGHRALRGPLFVEAGLDMYGSIERSAEGDLPLDRTSGLISAAVGARTEVTSWLGGYIQLGGGVELTSVSVPYGEMRIRDRKAMPEGFFGIGADIQLGKGTRIGANVRTLLMGNFDYDPARLDMENGWIAAPSSGEVFDASPDVAAQAQFYLRREI
jgi:hypothetical protein